MDVKYFQINYQCQNNASLNDQCASNCTYSIPAISGTKGKADVEVTDLGQTSAIATGLSEISDTEEIRKQIS